MSAPTTATASATYQIIGASAGAILGLLLLVGGTIGLCLKYRPACCFTPSDRLRGTRKWNYDTTKNKDEIDYENDQDGYEQITPLDSFNTQQLTKPVEMLHLGSLNLGEHKKTERKGSTTSAYSLNLGEQVKSERKDSSTSAYSLDLGERDIEGDYIDTTMVGEGPKKPKKTAPGRPARTP